MTVTRFLLKNKNKTGLEDGALHSYRRTQTANRSTALENQLMAAQASLLIAYISAQRFLPA